MTFLEECIQDSLPIWERCLDTFFTGGSRRHPLRGVL